MEVRNFLRQQKSPIDYAIKHLGDQRVLAAIWNSPLPDLVGMSQAEFDYIKHKALTTAHPQQAEAIAALSKTLHELDSGMSAMKKLICERCEIRADADGEFRSIPEPAPRACRW